jgi:hypothetical protein
MPDLARKTFPGSELFKSPWWVPALTFNALTHTASKTGANLSDTARSRLAVTKEFSPTMDKIVIVEVKESVYGWIGPATHQPATGGDRSVLLLGNFQQLYIPNLASDSRGLTSKVGMLIYHGMVQ